MNNWPLNSLETMRRSEKHMPNLEAAKAVLHVADVLHLGLCGEEGWPYVVPVNFALVDEVIYVHSARHGRKMEILRHNNRVCFQAETDVALSQPSDPARACQWGMRFRSVVGFGYATIHTDEPTLHKGLNALMARYSRKEFTYPEAILHKTAVIAISIEALTGKQSGVED